MTYRVTRCDICNKDVSNADIKYKFKRYENSYANYDDFEFKKWSKLDMCEECYEKLLCFVVDEKMRLERNTLVE